jgi:drug/metabolite transporter (DMT)-like permease
VVSGPAQWKLLAALWTVYLVWGSTYLGIKIAVETLPAFLSAGTRFLLAAGLLAIIVALTGRSIRISRRELIGSAVLGVSLLGLGVGGVTLAETRIDSSTAAMIAGSVPLQVIVLRTLARERVALATRLSVLVGLAGLALLVLPGGEGSSSAVGLAVALGASISWSLGSFFGHRLPLPRDGFVATTWEMLSAGVFLVVLGAATGELGSADPAGFSLESVAAWLYLAVFGSLIGFTAYAWLLRNAPISKVVTHQYVNPLVAIILGAAVLDERLTLTTGIGAALIIGSVFVAVRRESGSESREVSISSSSVRLNGDHPEKEEAMKYMLLIHQGDTPLPGTDAWEQLSEEEQKAVYADYAAINQTPGVTPSDVWLESPEAATTVRVEDGKTLTTDGPFVAVKEALGGYLFFEADNLDAAIELASRIPAARMGGAVEVRPIKEQ